MDKIESHLKKLNSFLETIETPVMSIDQIHGLITAFACGPYPIPPTEWLSLIFGRETDRPIFKSPEQAEGIFQKLISINNIINESLEKEDFAPYVAYSEIDGKKVLEPAGWCNGFLIGSSVYAEDWDILDDDDFGDIMLFIFYLSDDEHFTKIFDKETMIFFNKQREQLIEELGNMVADIYYYFRGNDFESDPDDEIPNIFSEKSSDNYTKIGRNDPCPCGSGKKYKKCCGMKFEN